MMEAGSAAETLVKSVRLQNIPEDSRLLTRLRKNQKSDRISFIFYLFLRIAFNSVFSQVILIAWKTHFGNKLLKDGSFTMNV
jgi:hypothetical protein